MTSAVSTGTLYLVPVSLAPVEWSRYLPPDVRSRTLSLDYFVAENAKTSRSKLKEMGCQRPLREIIVETLPERPSKEDLERLLRPVIAGRDCGLMSEAGCPGVADPGASLVRAAHREDVRVVPLVGPSSILLALMASGLNGQSFAFLGYLPIAKRERQASIRSLERESLERGATQIFIETPYRNRSLVALLLETCQPQTLLCVATNITGRTESVVTRSIADWRRAQAPEIDRQPSVFLLLAQSSAQPNL